LSEKRIETLLNDLFKTANELTEELRPCDELFQRAGMKPIAEAGIKDKVTMAQLILKIKKLS
jgi:hypothetical protein